MREFSGVGEERPGTGTGTGGRATESAKRIAKGLGWFSLGLGTAQVIAPGIVARVIGAPDKPLTRWIMRGAGVREILAGIGILSAKKPAPFVSGRFGADLIDLALLAAAFRSPESSKARLFVTTAAVAGVTVLDFLTARELERTEGAGAVTKSITIDRAPEDVYRFYRRLENLPRFSAHLESVRELDARRSHWVASGPGGARVEWDAEIFEDRPGELIAWRSVEGADVASSGRVRFVRAPHGGTEVHVEMRYEPPFGRFGATIAKILGREPSQQIEGDLRRLKQLLEIGEVVHSDSSIHRMPHPARPPSATA